MTGRFSFLCPATAKEIIFTTPSTSHNKEPPMATKRVVDLVFLVDVTGSMRPCIDGLKDSIDKFFQHLTNEEENKLAIRDWRAKVVGYRDVSYDKDNWLDNNPFVTSAEEIHQQLDALKAKGGGDEPESLLDALLTIADMEETSHQENPDPFKWRHRRDAARAVCVFTDAPQRAARGLRALLHGPRDYR